MNVLFLHLPLARRSFQSQFAMPEPLTHLPTDQIDLKGFDLVGVSALRALLDPTVHVGPTADDAAASLPVDLPGIGALVDEIASAGHGLVMMMGGAVSLFDRRLRVGAPARRKATAKPATEGAA